MQDARQPPQPAPDAQSFQTLYCTEVQSSSLRSEDRTCSLCVTRYGDPSPDEQGTPERPVQIHFGDCHHVFGHRCLRKLFEGRNAWSNKCPLCRTHWFNTIRDTSASVLLEIILAMQEPTRENAEAAWPTRPFEDPYSFVEDTLSAEIPEISRIAASGTVRTDRVHFTYHPREPVESPWPERRRRLGTAVRDTIARLRGRRDGDDRSNRADTPQAARPEGVEGHVRLAGSLRPVRVERAGRLARMLGPPRQTITIGPASRAVEANNTHVRAASARSDSFSSSSSSSSSTTSRGEEHIFLGGLQRSRRRIGTRGTVRDLWTVVQLLEQANRMAVTTCVRCGRARSHNARPGCCRR